MTVLVVLAILASIAVPSYRSYIAASQPLGREECAHAAAGGAGEVLPAVQLVHQR